MAGDEGNPRASSRTYCTADNAQAIGDVEIPKVKEPVNSLDAKGTPIPKSGCALVRAVLQTAPEHLAVSTAHAAPEQAFLLLSPSPSHTWTLPGRDRFSFTDGGFFRLFYRKTHLSP